MSKGTNLVIKTIVFVWRFLLYYVLKIYMIVKKLNAKDAF